MERPRPIRRSRRFLGAERRETDLREQLSRAEASIVELRSRVRSLERDVEREVERRAKTTEERRRFGSAFKRVAAAIRATPPSRFERPPGPPEREEIRDLLATVSERHRLAGFANAVATGSPLTEGLLELVRRPRTLEQRYWARAFGDSLLSDADADRQIGALVSAVAAVGMGAREVAWSRFTELSDHCWARWAPTEYLETALVVDRDAAIRAVDRALDGSLAGVIEVDAWIMVVEHLTSTGDIERARRIAHHVQERHGDEPHPRLARLERWLDEGSADGTAPDGRTESTADLRLAVLACNAPELRRASTNLGDDIQALALLVHVARRQGTRLSGESGLIEVVRVLGEQVSPDHVLDRPDSSIGLVSVDRDASHLTAVPRGTWVVVFGWFASRRLDGSFDFPVVAAADHLYVSFHCNRPEMLTDDVIDHLRRSEPIGCRDRTTVDLLRGAGVEAFFSGCLTSTLGPLIGAVEERAGPVLFIDVDPPGDAGSDEIAVLQQQDREIRDAAPSEKLHQALEWIEMLRSAPAVTTSRVHSCIPARSFGTPVAFRPRSETWDARFPGLIDAADDEIISMGHRLADRLADVFDVMIAGGSSDDVHQRWRELWADELLLAPAPGTVLERLPRLVDLDAVRDAEQMVEMPPLEPGDPAATVEIAVALDERLREELLVLIESITTTTKRPLRLTVLTRGLDRSYLESIQQLFPTLALRWRPCDDLIYGDVGSMLPHTTLSTMDRLVLPELLGDLDRVLYLDVDVMVRADVGELFDIDLGSAALAAAGSGRADQTNGFRTNVQRRAAQLDQALGEELVRRVVAARGCGFEGFNAGVLVMNLARMRADRFVEEYTPYAARYGLHDQQILNIYAAGRRSAIDPSWNHLPSHVFDDDPKLVHWAGPYKPWGSMFVLRRNEWRALRETVTARQDSLA